MMWLKGSFGTSVDFYIKESKFCDVKYAVVMCDDLSGVENSWEMVLWPLRGERNDFTDGEQLMEYLMNNSTMAFSSKKVMTLEDMRFAMTSGHSVLMADGCDYALIFSTQDFIQRGVSPSDTEVSVYGSKEAFSDVLRKNMGLVRRRIRTDGLIIETLNIGTATKTEVAIIYHNKYVNKQMLSDIKEKLDKIDIQMVLDTSYLAPFLESEPYALVGGVGVTERADTLCAKVCEGKVAILADGTPYSIIVPFFFSENFQCMDDYSAKPYYTSFIRILKYMAFFIAILLPGIFVAAANFTPEIFPGKLLYKIAESEASTPLPLFMEAIFVNILLEIIKEAGLRLPKAIGHSVSLVAALIVGDAAIKFGILGSPIVIIAAISAICGFVVPTLYQPITILRMMFILAGGILGPYGIAVLLVFMMFGISGIDSFGLPYTAPITPFSKGFFQDGIIRVSWKSMHRGFFTIKDYRKKKGGNESEK